MTNFNTAVAASADDGYEVAAGAVTLNLRLNANNNGDLFGMRFVNVTIPQGSTITAAYFWGKCYSGSYDDPDLTIYADAADDSAQFTTTAHDISGRTPTTATVAWTATNIGTTGSNSPELKTIIQEIIDRVDWASGNALSIIAVANSDASNFRLFAYDDGTDIPYIDITYTAPAGGGTVRVFMNHYRQLMGA